MVKYHTEDERKAARREKMREYHKRSYQKHAEKRKQAQLEYYAKNKESVKEKARVYGKIYYQCNKEQIKEKSHKYYQQHKDEILEKRKDYIKEYCENNRERLNAQSRAYKKKNDAIVKLRNKLYRDSHKKEIAEYREEHREDLRKYMTKCMKNYRRKNKIEAIHLLGGKCSICGVSYDGTNAAIFDFHHVNPKEKECVLSKLFAFSELSEEAKRELSKCILVCSNCHRMIHFNDC